MPGSVTIGGSNTGLSGGSQVYGPETIIGLNTETACYVPILSTGDNEFAIPSGTVAIYFVPASGLAAVKLRTVSGDSGIYVSPLNPTVISLDPLNTPLDLWVNVGTAAGSNSEIWFV